MIKIKSESIEMQSARQRYRDICDTSNGVCPVLPNRVTYELGFAQLVKPCEARYTYKQDVSCDAPTRMECEYYMEEVEKIANKLTEGVPQWQ